MKAYFGAALLNHIPDANHTEVEVALRRISMFPSVRSLVFPLTSFPKCEYHAHQPSSELALPQFNPKVYSESPCDDVFFSAVTRCLRLLQIFLCQYRCILEVLNPLKRPPSRPVVMPKRCLVSITNFYLVELLNSASQF